MTTTDEILTSLKPWMQKNTRKTWIPIVSDGDGDPTDSKFGGTPFTNASAPWPECSNCKQALQHFFQLNLDKIPDELKGKYGSGLLQLFYCIKDDCQGMGGWEPFAEDLSRVRIITPNGVADPGQKSEFPAKLITGWKTEPDLPDPEDHDDLGLVYNYDLKSETVDLECTEFGLHFEKIDDEELAEKIGTAVAGDKLSGWPLWIQGPEYPSCPECGEHMQLLFQIDSEINVPWMWGDAGCSHITQCPEHKNVVAFAWACG